MCGSNFSADPPFKFAVTGYILGTTTNLLDTPTINDRDVIHVVKSATRQIAKTFSGPQQWLVTRILSVTRSLETDRHHVGSVIYVVDIQMSESECKKQDSSHSTSSGLYSLCAVHFQTTQTKTCKVILNKMKGYGNIKILGQTCVDMKGNNI